jgi:hypothetical protein
MLEMHGRHDMWETWYLDVTIATRPGKYNANFATYKSYIVRIGCLII